jgi:hypothetical protein
MRVPHIRIPETFAATFTITALTAISKASLITTGAGSYISP